jgi:CDP-diacylglycerol--glycerol-3-phosphate 3-phosphatidyltransferase
MPARMELRSVPNWISFSRLLLAAAFVATDATGSRIALICLAAVTDFLDGYVARRFNTATRWGALIDPIADRVFVLVAVSTFLFLGQVSTLGYFIMIFRDLMTAIGFLVARMVSWLRPVEFKARLAGKVVTSLQLLTFAAIMLRPSWVTPLLALVAAASVWAVYDYTMALWLARAP